MSSLRKASGGGGGLTADDDRESDAGGHGHEEAGEEADDAQSQEHDGSGQTPTEDAEVELGDEKERELKPGALPRPSMAELTNMMRLAAGGSQMGAPGAFRFPTPGRKRPNLPDKTIQSLRRWLLEHWDHPYPSKDDKQGLAMEAGLDIRQVTNWFVNARARIWKPLVQKHLHGLGAAPAPDASAVMSADADQGMDDKVAVDVTGTGPPTATASQTGGSRVMPQSPQPASAAPEDGTRKRRGAGRPRRDGSKSPQPRGKRTRTAATKRAPWEVVDDDTPSDSDSDAYGAGFMTTASGAGAAAAGGGTEGSDEAENPVVRAALNSPELGPFRQMLDQEQLVPRLEEFQAQCMHWLGKAEGLLATNPPAVPKLQRHGVAADALLRFHSSLQSARSRIPSMQSQPLNVLIAMAASAQNRNLSKNAPSLIKVFWLMDKADRLIASVMRHRTFIRMVLWSLHVEQVWNLCHRSGAAEEWPPQELLRQAEELKSEAKQYQAEEGEHYARAVGWMNMLIASRTAAPGLLPPAPRRSQQEATSVDILLSAHTLPLSQLEVLVSKLAAGRDQTHMQAACASTRAWLDAITAAASGPTSLRALQSLLTEGGSLDLRTSEVLSACNGLHLRLVAIGYWLRAAEGALAGTSLSDRSAWGLNFLQGSSRSDKPIASMVPFTEYDLTLLIEQGQSIVPQVEEVVEALQFLDNAKMEILSLSASRTSRVMPTA